MLEQLQQVETSVIDELMGIKQERETIAERLAKMSEDQGKVSEVVYRRVRRDYEARLAALERKAAPLKDRARQEYAKLKALLDKLQGVHQATRLDREEIDFRHKLGEFKDDEFKKRVGELDDKLDEQKGSLEQIEAVREQFLGTVESELELTAPPTTAATPPPPVTPPPPEAEPFVAPPPPLPDAGITAPQPVVTPLALTQEGLAAPPPILAAAEPAPAPIPAIPAPAQDGTVILPPEAPPAAPGATVLTPPAAAVGSETSPTTGKTVVLARGKLIAIDTDLGATEFSLEPLTFIGRTPENQIRLNKPAVSRRHAQIAQSESGYVLRDLNSENGTYVNGERVKEKPLGDGDRVQIGTVRFVFRAG